jgi:hypothetical protein
MSSSIASVAKKHSSKRIVWFGQVDESSLSDIR